MTWTKGQSGNPQGKRAGVKDRFVRKFWCDILEDWNKHGLDAIEQCRENDPTGYVRIMASMVPKPEQAQELRHAIQITLQEPEWMRLPAPETRTINLEPDKSSDDNNHNGNRKNGRHDKE